MRILSTLKHLSLPPLPSPPIILGDSTLVINSLKKRRPPCDGKLIPIYDSCIHFLSLLPFAPTFRHIPRSQNQRADILANAASISPTAPSHLNLCTNNRLLPSTTKPYPPISLISLLREKISPSSEYPPKHWFPTSRFPSTLPKPTHFHPSQPFPFHTTPKTPYSLANHQPQPTLHTHTRWLPMQAGAMHKYMQRCVQETYIVCGNPHMYIYNI